MQERSDARTRSRFSVRLAGVTGAMAAAVLFASAGAATAASSTSSTHDLPHAGPKVVPNSQPTWATPSARAGTTPAGQQITARLYLGLPDQAGTEALATAVSDPDSPSYGKYLTPQQVQARIAPPQSAVDTVRAWAGTTGLRVAGKVPANRLYVEVQGTAAQVQAAFGVQLGQYTVNGKQYRASDRPLTVPSAISKVVSGVAGVNQTVSHATPATVPPSPGFRNSGPCGAYYGEKTTSALPKFDGLPRTLPYAPCGYVPSQVRSAYGIADATAKGLDGKGQTVAIIDAFASPTILADAQQYAQRNDPTHPLASTQFDQVIFPVTHEYEAPDQCDAAGWYGEETLDVEAVHATAPGANIVYVGASDCQDQSLDTALNEVVANHLADVVSNSYGSLGEDIPAEEVQALNTIAIEAALEGITITFSSGDSGDDAAAVGYPTPDFEASDPFVTAVGGTSLGIGKDGKRVVETGWETNKATLTNGAWDPKAPGAYLYGSGGGTSRLFAQPSYQKGVVPDSLAKKNQAKGNKGRVVPDISMLGDPNTGFLVGQTQTFPDGVYYSQYRIGGTSLSSPLLAGTVAVSNQKHGAPAGFINPVIYKKLSHNGSITDVKHVDGAVVRVDFANTVDASAGLITSLRTFDSQSLAIRTRSGYDDVTGLGTPNGLAFLAGL
jgi:subtilase family serine protease